MANNLRRAEEFDRGRDFVVVREVTVNGKTYVPGEPFDPTEVTVRRLRQMYDARMIDLPATGQPKVAPPPSPPEVASEDAAPRSVRVRQGARRQ